MNSALMIKKDKNTINKLNEKISEKKNEKNKVFVASQASFHFIAFFACFFVFFLCVSWMLEPNDKRNYFSFPYFIFTFTGFFLILFWLFFFFFSFLSHLLIFNDIIMTRGYIHVHTLSSNIRQIHCLFLFFVFFALSGLSALIHFVLFIFTFILFSFFLPEKQYI